MRFAVVDVETTGVGNHDRIVEIAIVTLDGSGHVVDEFDTLVNPERDVGPTSIHGITASMVSLAPTFDEICGAVADRLHGAVIVCHNVGFDTRFLGISFQKSGRGVDPGDGICTLRLTGERLPHACSRYGIALEDHHRALADARATAHLFLRLFRRPPSTSREARVEGTFPDAPVRTLRRDAVGGYGTIENPVLDRLIAKTRFPSSSQAVVAYLDSLDWVLDDLVVTRTEADMLNEVASSYGLSDAERRQAHRQYVDAIIAAAVRDGIVTADEHGVIRQVANALGVEDITVPEPSELPRAGPLDPGMRVCFSGAAVDRFGEVILREQLETIAAMAGLQPVSAVTKKGCDLLVVADTATASGKAQNARKWNIPVMSVDEFLSIVQPGA